MKINKIIEVSELPKGGMAQCEARPCGKLESPKGGMARCEARPCGKLELPKGGMAQCEARPCGKLDSRVFQRYHIIIFALLLLTSTVLAEDVAIPATGVSALPNPGDIIKVVDKVSAPAANGGQDWSGPIKLFVVFTALALLPSLLVMMTSFTRIIIVLSFVRRALTTQTIPPTIALIGLAMFLTIFTMAPTFAKINTHAIAPYIADKITATAAGELAGSDLKEFMLKQTRPQDLAVFIEMSKTQAPKSAMDIPLFIVTPAFIISEFRTSFEIGCLIFIPFLLIDLVISSILLSAGMMMLPPQMISLPFKLILFILVDGWGLLAKSLSMGFN